jgi:hypothetical protein
MSTGHTHHNITSYHLPLNRYGLPPHTKHLGHQKSFSPPTNQAALPKSFAPIGPAESYKRGGSLGIRSMVLYNAYRKGKQQNNFSDSIFPQLLNRRKTTWRQQERLLFKAFREHNLPLDFTPHRKMVLDLQAWLQHLIAGEHQLILCIDANET